MPVILARASQQAAGYRPEGGVERCGYCRFFVSQGTCNRIIGPVSPRGWCRYFSREIWLRMDAGADDDIAVASGPVAPPGVTLDLNFMLGSLPSGLTFTRASTATYFDSNGTMQTAATNTPRFDYNPSTKVLNGLLIEEARTNLLLNSATLSTQSVTVTAQAYTLSFYGTGTITKSGTSTGALVGSGAFPQRVSQTFTPTAGSLTLTVTGTVQNAQLEAGAYPTSYITTTAAAATRSADACNGTIGAWYSATASTFVLEGMMMRAWATGQNSYWLIVDDGSASNRIGMFIQVSAPTSIGTILGAGGTSYANGTGGLNVTPPAIFKYAIAVGGGHLLVYGNAAQTLSIAAGTPTGVNRFSLGSLGTVPISSYLRRVRYWPRVLTAAELGQVTT